MFDFFKTTSTLSDREAAKARARRRREIRRTQMQALGQRI